MEIKELTKAEEEIMQILWELDGGFVKDIITEIPLLPHEPFRVVIPINPN